MALKADTGIINTLSAHEKMQSLHISEIASHCLLCVIADDWNFAFLVVISQCE